MARGRLRCWFWGVLSRASFWLWVGVLRLGFVVRGVHEWCNGRESAARHGCVVEGVGSGVVKGFVVWCRDLWSRWDADDRECSGLIRRCSGFHGHLFGKK